MPNPNAIPGPSTPFVDPKTGLVNREWYRFLANSASLSQPNIFQQLAKFLKGINVTGGITTDTLTASKNVIASPGVLGANLSNGMLAGDMVASRGDGTGIVFLADGRAAGDGKYIYWDGNRIHFGDHDTPIQVSQVYESSPNYVSHYSTQSYTGPYGGNLITNSYDLNNNVSLTGGIWDVEITTNAFNTNNQDTMSLGIYSVTDAAQMNDINGNVAASPADTPSGINTPINLRVRAILNLASSKTICPVVYRNGGSTPNIGVSGATAITPITRIIAKRWG